MRLTGLFLLLCLALLTLALHRAASPAAAGTRDLRLSTIAGELARRHVSIRCEGSSGNLTGVDGSSGRTEFLNGKPASVAYLQEGICQLLHRYSRETKSGLCSLACNEPLQLAWSLNALAHESYHLAGVRNEAETECYALQAINFVARRLGAAPAEASELAAFAFTQLPSRMPPAYSSPQCRRGGRYDLGRANPVWPS
ncbi:MAG TPA: hypothetical protein VF002_02475 [Gaiellaceae bacterium]